MGCRQSSASWENFRTDLGPGHSCKLLSSVGFKGLRFRVQGFDKMEGKLRLGSFSSCT